MKKQLMFLILNKTNVLSKLLSKLSDNGIKGATVINSVGMACVLASLEENMSFSPFKMMYENEGSDNKTIFMVIDEDQIPIVKKIVVALVGDISKPNTAFMFSVPLSYVDGSSSIE